MNKLYTTISAVLALATSATADLFYSGVQTIPIPATFDGVYLYLNDPADASVFTVDTSSTPAPGWDFNFFFGGAALWDSPDVMPVMMANTVNSTLVNLSSGTPIDAASIFYTGGFSGSDDHHAMGEFATGAPGYSGFAWDHDDNVGTAPYYGWLKVTLNEDGSPGTIHSWAWTDDSSIAASAVPEPGSLAFMGLGILLLQRRSR